MKLGISKKTIIFIVTITIMVFAGLVIIINLMTKTNDENITKYNQAMRMSLEKNYHMLVEETRLNISDKPLHRDEYFRYGKNNLRISTYPEETIHMESHIMVYDDKEYSYSVNGDVVDVAVHSSVTPTDGIPDGIDSTYYLIDARNVTYEETETQFIVTYNNKNRVGRSVLKTYKEDVVGGYTEAFSVAYFDKEWNLQKLIVTDKWNVLSENGENQERERIICLTYYDTSEEEILKALEDEYNMIQAELNGN